MDKKEIYAFWVQCFDAQEIKMEWPFDSIFMHYKMIQVVGESWGTLIVKTLYPIGNDQKLHLIK